LTLLRCKKSGILRMAVLTSETIQISLWS